MADIKAQDIFMWFVKGLILIVAYIGLNILIFGGLKIFGIVNIIMNLFISGIILIIIGAISDMLPRRKQ